MPSLVKPITCLQRSDPVEKQYRYSQGRLAYVCEREEIFMIQIHLPPLTPNFPRLCKM